jgi:uncharacterized protein (UPF0332 family)
VNPNQFILLAEKLIAFCLQNKPISGIDQDLRTAISRIYYSVFLNSRALLIDLGYEVTVTGTCHSIVKKAFENSNDPDLDRTASDYGTLGEYRRKADYDLNAKDVEDSRKAGELLQLGKKANARIAEARNRIKTDIAYANKLITEIEKWRKSDPTKDIRR